MIEKLKCTVCNQEPTLYVGGIAMLGKSGMIFWHIACAKATLKKEQIAQLMRELN